MATYLAHYPEDRQAQDQQLRLRAQDLTPDSVIQEVDTLEALGEQIPEALAPRFSQSLLEHGRHADARAFLAQHRSALSSRAMTGLAWTFYRAQVYDIACELFLAGWEEHRRSVKYLAALEMAADRAGRLAELVALYQTHAPEQRTLYGRVRRLPDA